MIIFRILSLLLVTLFINGHSLNFDVPPNIVYKTVVDPRDFHGNITYGVDPANWTDGFGNFINTTVKQIPGVWRVGGKGSCSDTKILFFIHGLMGSDQQNWQTIQEQFGIKKLQECGALVRVLISTSLSVRCYLKDTKCQKSQTKQTNEEYLANIEKTYAPLLMGIATSEFTVRPKPTDADLADTVFTNSLFYNWNIESFINTFTHAIAIKTNVILTQPLDILSTCSSFPGMSIISGENNVNCGYHHRDPNLAQLACGAYMLTDYYEPNTKCRHWKGCQKKKSKPPSLPAGFTGNWKNVCAERSKVGEHFPDPCDTVQCDRVLKFSTDKVRFGTLDKHKIFAKLMVPSTKKK